MAAQTLDFDLLIHFSVDDKSVRCAFRASSNSLGLLYAFCTGSSHHRVIYLEGMIHKLLNITERLAGVQLSTLFLLQLRLTDAAVFLQLPVQQ